MKYYIIGGTLLGAVRHGGFIPWDIDADVAMPRKDYEKFLEVSKNNFQSEYFIQNIFTEEKFHTPKTKILVRGAKKNNPSKYMISSKTGLNLDIFPLDYAPTVIIIKKGWKKINYKFFVVLIIALIVFFILIPDTIKDGTLERFLGLGVIFDSNSDISDLSASRFQFLQRGSTIFRDNPIIGGGAGSYMYYGGVNMPISHNDYLLVLAEQGIIGFVIFAILILSFVKMAFKTYMRTKTNMDQSILISVVGVMFYLLLINAYDNILLWTLFAFVSARYTFVNHQSEQVVSIAAYS